MTRCAGVPGPRPPPPVQFLTAVSAWYSRARVTCPPSLSSCSTKSLAESHPSMPKMEGWQPPQNDLRVETYSRISRLESVKVGNTERIQMFWLATQLPPTRWTNEGS